MEQNTKGKQRDFGAASATATFGDAACEGIVPKARVSADPVSKSGAFPKLLCLFASLAAVPATGFDFGALYRKLA